MARYQVRDAEDYLRGSSDRPLTLGMTDESHFSKGLERRFEGLKLSVCKPDGTLDVKATNDARLAYVRRERLVPAMERYVHGCHDIFYRIVEYNQDGLMNIAYVTDMPAKLEPLDRNDAVSITVAVNLLKCNKAELRRLMKDDKVRGTNTSVNLPDINALL